MLSRARTRWCPLVAVLLAVLGSVCGPAVAAERASAVAAERAAPPAAVFAQDADGSGAPGCGPGGKADSGQRPAVPPRPGPASELLPAPYDARALSGDWGAWGADQDVIAVARALRAPPPVAPPTPVGLSVLRV
ncbi:hypothetical protein [Streptomyces sp. G45]|uniref:hypothetical protein n=1 Tax=Streptomyces sp. G45 TaxID=3406627 RepID=UPI003C2217EA